MKTYEEMAQNALKRIENYKTEKNKKRKTAAKITIPVMSFCLVAILGFGIWKTGMFANNGDTVYDGDSAPYSSENFGNGKNPQTNQYSDDTDCCDEVAVIYKDGRLFAQTDADISKYSKGGYLGKASDFDGFYKKHPEVDGELFQSAEDENVLLAFLENGSVVILKFSE